MDRNLGFFRRIDETRGRASQGEIDLSGANAPRKFSTTNTNEPIEDKLRKNGLEKVDWHGKCHPDELLRGSYDIGPNQGGTYALIFDNTFSKSTSKTVLFSQRVVQLTSDGNSSTHLSSATRSASLAAESISEHASSKLGSDVVTTKETTASRVQPSCFSDGRHLRGVMLKRRRKKLQGYARRYFSLDYKYGTLNYFSSQTSSILRGSMPIKLCVVSAREKSRDIYIDSGMELWNVKPLNATDFKTWVAALEVARLGASVIASKGPQTYSNILLSSMPPSAVANRLSVMLNGTKSPNFQGLQNSSNGVNATSKIWDQLETLTTRLEATTNKVSQEAEKQDKPCDENSFSFDLAQKPPGSGPQRRPSFWKRRSSRQSAPVISSMSNTSNSSNQDLGPTDVPPLPTSPLLPQILVDSSIEDISKLNLKSNGVPSSSPSPPPLNQISTELKSLLNDFKNLLRDSKEELQSQSYAFGRRRLSIDAASILSDEFFDAEEFNNNQDGVVYLGQNESSSDEDDNLLAENLEDDSPSDDEVGAFTGSTTHLPAPAYKVKTNSSETGGNNSSQNLYPLTILKGFPKRRKNISPAVANPPNLLTFIRKNIGKDLSSVAMPVTANEPLTLLQRFSEIFEHTNLLDTALKFPEKSPERILYIATFAAVFAASTRAKERAGRKPFNSLLGETFELVRAEQGMRLIAEKVSHHPPIMAIQAETSAWTMQYSPSPHQQIWGKSVELINKGTVRFSVNSTGEVYEWKSPTTFLRNIIAGEKYSEPVGSLTVICSNGWRSVFEYKAGGMFSGRSEDMKGKVFSPDGKEIHGYEAEGKWTTSVDLSTPKEKTTIWNAGPLVDDYSKRFGFTQFAATLNEITEVEHGLVAPTDSRLRPDQRMYENGDVDGAEVKKLELEQHQRDRRGELASAAKKYEPIFFEPGTDDVWNLKKGSHNYWDRRKRQDWDGLIDIFA